MQRLDPSPWNLASVAARAMPLTIMIAACGPVVAVPGDTDGDTDVDPTHPTDPSDPSDPSNPSDPSDPTTPAQCDAYNPCGYGYDCIDGVCIPDYYCADGCCYDGEGGCCYGDGGCYYYDCTYDIDCGSGYVCGDFGNCEPAQVVPECSTPVFSQAIPIEIGAPVLSLAFFDGDGDAPREFAVGLQNGAGVIPGANAGPANVLLIPFGAQADDIAAGDLDLDGDVDLLVSTSGATSGFSAFYNDGAGGFGLGIGPGGVSRRFELADIDGDGLVDVVGTFDFGGPSEQLAIVRALGSGTYDAPYIHEVSGQPVLDFETAPLLGGVGSELIAFDSDIVAIWNHGPLDGAADQYLWGGGYVAGSLAVGDFDGNGALDVVRAQYYFGGTMVRYFYGDGGGGFSLGQPVWVTSEYDAASAGDVDGDGYAEVLLGGTGGGLLVLRSTSPTGDACSSYTFTDGSSAVQAVGDFTGDGIADVAHAEGTRVLVHAL